MGGVCSDEEVESEDVGSDVTPEKCYNGCVTSLSLTVVIQWSFSNSYTKGIEVS